MNTSPIGPLEVRAGERGVTHILAEEASMQAAVTEAETQLEEYFAGKRTEFSVKLSPEGTPFQKAVWAAMRRIPYGKVVTYGQLAAAIGRPTACRAVANAVGKNPILIVQPCHRVVAANGLGGFSSGVERKRTLLRLEGVEIAENSPFSEKFIFTFP